MEFGTEFCLNLPNTFKFWLKSDNNTEHTGACKATMFQMKVVKKIWNMYFMSKIVFPLTHMISETN
jgi:hypothetical protein